MHEASLTLRGCRSPFDGLSNSLERKFFVGSELEL